MIFLEKEKLESINIQDITINNESKDTNEPAVFDELTYRTCSAKGRQLKIFNFSVEAKNCMII